MKVVKVRVGRGRTSRPSEAEEWVREYYELEIEITDDKEIPIARDYALSLIDQWLAQLPTAPEWIPKLDIGEINDLLWTTYKTKERAKPAQAAWTFSDPTRHDKAEDKHVVEELVKAIRASSDGNLQLGDMEFSFSGAEKQFISRRPARQKK